MAVRPRSTSIPSKTGVQCRIEGGQFVCDFNASARAKVRNESVEQACVVDTQTKRWNCPTVPGLHGKPVRASAVRRDTSHGQGWVSVGEMQIPVPTTPISRGKSVMSSIGNTLSNFARALISPIVGQRHTSDSVLSMKMRGGGPVKFHPPFYGVHSTNKLRYCANYTYSDGQVVRICTPSSAPKEKLSFVYAGHSSKWAARSRLANYGGGGMVFYGDRRTNPPTITSFTAPTSRCCYDAETGRLVCPTSPVIHGSKVALLGVDNPNSATPRARIQLPNGRERSVPICPSGGMQPGSGMPEDCCYDPMTKSLRCPSSQSLDGQPATVTSEFTATDGRKMVVAMTADGESITVPYCRPPADVPQPPNCCVNERTMQIVCDDPNHPWNGIDVTLVADCYDDPESGQRLCFIDISGDTNTILPVCDYPDLTTPTPPEQPPSVTGCCFRRSTMTIECDDTSSPLHGVVVPAAAVSFGDTWADITIGGDVYNRIPLCSEGPPLRTPPGTPPGECPPGQHMTPSGMCDYDTPPPPSPPHDHHDGEPCCDSCAKGRPCESTCSG